jgi:DNA-binding MarR family transcriptional regulator
MPDSPLTEQEEAVMRALGRLLVVLPKVLGADLERDQRMTLSEYQALRQLSEAEGRTMRMSELAGCCDMSLSGMTRLAGKLESLGFVRRVRHEADRRGLNAVLTDAGLARLECAWPSHLASARRRIFDHLGSLDLEKLAAALESMNKA